jgi:hypothetical protein
MKKYIADGKDARWRANRMRKHGYKCGCRFKGCLACGETDYDRNDKLVYITGHNVYRAYDPKWMKWTYKCLDCGKTDRECWEDAKDIGQSYIGGCRNTIFKDDPTPFGTNRLKKSRIAGYGLEEKSDKPLFKRAKAAPRTVQMDEDLVARLTELLKKG